MLKETIKYYLLETLLPVLLFLLSLIFVIISFIIKKDLLVILALVALAPLLVWLIIRIRPVFVALRLQNKCYEKMINDQNKKGVVIEEGGNRTGKSLDGFATLYYKALSLEMYVNRFTKLYRAKKTKQKLNQKEFLEFREINETYKFYRKHPELISCFVTNVKVADSFGRSSMELLGSHLLQLDKFPRPCAVGLDESSNKVENMIYKDKEGSTIVDNTARFINQYTGDNSLFVLMEQNSARTYIGFRSAVCVIKNQKGVQVLLEPVRLLKKLNKLFEQLDETEKPSYEFACKILSLYKRIKRIGVLQLNFTLFGNKESSGEILSKGVIQEYLPCDLPFSYDNRFFRTGYLCKDDDIKLSRFKGNLQSENQVDDLIRLVEIDGKPTMAYRGENAKELWQKAKTKDKLD